MFCPPIRFTGAAVSHVPAAFTLAVVVDEQPTPPWVTVTAPIEPLLFTAATACAVQLPLNFSGTVAPYGSQPSPASGPTATDVTAPPAAVTVNAGCIAFHAGITTALRTVHPCWPLGRSSTSPVGGSPVAAELPASATTLSSTLFDPAAAVNACVAWIVTFSQRFESAFSPAGVCTGSAGMATPVLSPRMSILRNSLHCGHCARYMPQVWVECAPAYCAIGSTPAAAISMFSITATFSPLPPDPVAAGIAMAQLPT